MAAPAPRFNPFPGLRPFEFDENHLFFGRDGQTDELLSRLRRFRFLAVVGTSGSGKSSLVRAGLLPDIHGGLMLEAGSSWRVALFKPGNDPIGNLARALTSPEAFSLRDAEIETPIIATTLRRSALGLIEVMRQERAGGNLLVVADQFEEIFRFQTISRQGQDDAAALVKLLLEAARQSELPIYVVLTMRSDYIGDCAQFGGLPEAINEGLYLIPRMTRDQRREAITGPVAVGGGEIAPRLVNRLLNDVGDNPDQLPLMQHALMRMWNCSEASGTARPIDLNDYEQVGTLTGALNQQADEAFASLSERGKELAPKIFKRLTEKGGDNREVRRPATVRELVAVSGGSEAEVTELIEAFRAPGRSFLMPPASRPLTLEALIDISHESLIRGWSRLREWVEEEAASAEMYDRLSETAALYETRQAGLWRDPDLQLALDWQARNRPSAAWAERYSTNFDRAIAFLEESRAARDAESRARQRERNIKRGLRYALIGVLAVTCLVFWIYSRQARQAQRKAEAAERIAQREERAARAEALRVRRQNLEKSTVVEMAERLVELTAPDEAAIWQSYKASSMAQLRKHEEAIQTYLAILEFQPDNAEAHFSLGYHYLVTGKAAQSLEQTEAMLRRDPNYWVAHQNRAIALAGLGRYDEAAAALQESDATFQTAVIDLSESELSPRIEKATGRTVLIVDENAVRAASPTAQANFRAFAGATDFLARLSSATGSKPLETYLTAVNWCWLQMKLRPEDYGALAAEGAWWEAAGFHPWAKEAFLDFQKQDRQKHDQRYKGLAAWVNERLSVLAEVELPKAKEDLDTLVMDAWENASRDRWKEAEQAVEEILRRDPESVRSLLMQVAYLCRHAWKVQSAAQMTEANELYRKAEEVCDKILQAHPTIASAYAWRAYAKQGLRAPDGEVEPDFRKALELQPLDASTMLSLSDLLQDRQPEEALELVDRALKASIGYVDLPYAYSRKANLLQAADRLPEALEAIQTAIQIKGDEARWYRTCAEIEHKLGRTETEVNVHLANGYRVVGDIEAKRGKKSNAFTQYWKSLENLAAIKALRASSWNDREIALALSRISSAIERISDSNVKAIEFWEGVVASGRLPAITPDIAAEVKKLQDSSLSDAPPIAPRSIPASPPPSP